METLKQLQDRAKQLKNFEVFQKILNALDQDADTMEGFIKTRSLRQVVALCKASGLEMSVEKLKAALDAGIVNYSTKRGRKPLTTEQKIEKLEAEIKERELQITKLKKEKNDK